MLLRYRFFHSTWILLGCYLDTTWILPKCYLQTTSIWILPFYFHSTSILLGYYSDTTKIPLQYYFNIDSSIPYLDTTRILLRCNWNIDASTPLATSTLLGSNLGGGELSAATEQRVDPGGRQLPHRRQDAIWPGSSDPTDQIPPSTGSRQPLLPERYFRANFNATKPRAGNCPSCDWGGGGGGGGGGTRGSFAPL